MKQAICPRCGSTKLQDLGDGYYKCLKCGYTGTLTGQGITKH